MIAIKRNTTYRHRNCIDVDMHIVRILWFTEDYFKLEVVWVNRHHPEVLIPDKIVRLNRKDLHNWSVVSGAA